MKLIRWFLSVVITAVILLAIYDLCYRDGQFFLSMASLAEKYFRLVLSFFMQLGEKLQVYRAIP